MSSPEQLTRRVGRTEEDVRAVADTAIEIRDTQREHGRKLETIDAPALWEAPSEEAAKQRCPPAEGVGVRAHLSVVVSGVRR
jgi:hypothetical protein